MWKVTSDPFRVALQFYVLKALKLYPLLNALISESSWLQGITTGPGAAPRSGLLFKSRTEPCVVFEISE